MSDTGSFGPTMAEEDALADRYASDLRCLIVMMAHLALDSEETNESIIRPGLLELARKVAGRMHLEFYGDLMRTGEDSDGRFDALLFLDGQMALYGGINGKAAMRAMYRELKQNGFEQRFFDGDQDKADG